jgi:hypothetical protein
MRLALRSLSVSFLALAFLSGCAATQAPPPVNGAAEAALSLDVPLEFAEGAAIPPRVEGNLHITFESKAIQAEPMRSRFDGKVTLVLTDPQKTRRYVDFAATLSGEYDGPPNEGWSRAAAQAVDLVSLFRQGLQKPEAEPKAP